MDLLRFICVVKVLVILLLWTVLILKTQHAETSLVVVVLSNKG